MKVVFIAALRLHGSSKKTGNPYDMCRVFYGVPFTNYSSEKYNRFGYGLDIKEIELLESALDDFSTVKAASIIDLKIEPSPRDHSRNICIGHS